VLTGHSPVFGILAEGSLVEIITEDSSVYAAVSGGFLSVADDRVAVLAEHAVLGREVDKQEVQRELEALLSRSSGAEEPAEAKYARAQLRAAADQA